MLPYSPDFMCLGRYGQGTRDMAGLSGLTTEQFVDKVAWRLGRYVAVDEEHVKPQVRL